MGEGYRECREHPKSEARVVGRVAMSESRSKPLVPATAQPLRTLHAG
jgi:hypothetical protein